MANIYQINHSTGAKDVADHFGGQTEKGFANGHADTLHKHWSALLYPKCLVGPLLVLLGFLPLFPGTTICIPLGEPAYLTFGVLGGPNLPGDKTR